MLDRKKTFSDNGIILESDWRDVGQQQRAGTKSKHQLITHPTPPPLWPTSPQFDNKSSGEGQSGKGGGELKLKSASTSWALMPTPVLEDYFAIFSEIHLYIFENLFCTWAHRCPPWCTWSYMWVQLNSQSEKIKELNVHRKGRGTIVGPSEFCN